MKNILIRGIIAGIIGGFILGLLFKIIEAATNIFLVFIII